MLAYARGALAEFLNASPEEIAFGANMTTLTLHLSRALGRQLARGDEIVVTELDHHANVDPWIQAARDREVVIRSVPLIPDSGQLDWDALRNVVGPRTRIVAIGGASNALGTVNDICAATRIAHSAGALVFIDAVHYAPHTLPDVRQIDCDFLACSAYKFNGPHVGVLYGRKELLQSTDFPRLEPAHHNAPERAETGTLNHEGIVGAGAAGDFFASLAEGSASRRERLEQFFHELHVRGSTLLQSLWDGLSAIDSVTLYGPEPGKPRTPTVAFTVKGMHSREVAAALAERGVFVSHGDFYALTVLRRLGLAEQGLVRAGCGIYTTHDEVSRLVDGVRQIAS
jgi:cysteine desulfurase family protein (TIGR01976 family)